MLWNPNNRNRQNTLKYEVKINGKCQQREKIFIQLWQYVPITVISRGLQWLSASCRSCSDLTGWLWSTEKVQCVLKSVWRARHVETVTMMICDLTTNSCVDRYPAVACCWLGHLSHLTTRIQTCALRQHMNSFNNQMIGIVCCCVSSSFVIKSMYIWRTKYKTCVKLKLKGAHERKLGQFVGQTTWCLQSTTRRSCFSATLYPIANPAS